MRMYSYRQNNSGGVFENSDTLGVFVAIEAETADAANEKAEDIGIYFDGCDNRRDCDCCGDRWYRADESDTTTDAKMLADVAEHRIHWNETRGHIYRADGTHEEVCHAPAL